MIACKRIVFHIDTQALAKLGATAEIKIIKAAALILVADVKKMLSVPGTSGFRTGEIYMKGKHKNITHQASAPGEPPAVDTGRLRNSIVNQKTHGGRVALIGAAATVEYAEYLEEGRPPKLKARPFLRAVLDRYTGTDELCRKATAHVMAVPFGE